MSRRRRRVGRGTLFVIAGLLVGSALIRIGDGAGQALALVPAETGVAADHLAAAGPACKTPEDLRAMLAAFAERDARLAAQEAALENRMQALRVADTETAERLAKLEAAEASLREMIALADSAAETDLDRLTRVYEAMKPKQAAALFEQMDPVFAAGFLGRMRPEAAAQVMAGLSPEAAHLFSVVLAGRNAEAPRE
ncbi:MotE family protein [Roseovarius amoyensis]|uniref:MotE family protein n=1 Tax=Roseovarius amoyensis TaxID=2211448 RepID=UPI000DBE8924|nr:hypothetical protein [Roseovarius amoyensis]